MKSIDERDVPDLLRCIDFRVSELRYALEPRNARALDALRLTGQDATAEVDRLLSLRTRVGS